MYKFLEVTVMYKFLEVTKHSPSSNMVSNNAAAQSRPLSLPLLPVSASKWRPFG